MAIVIEKEKNGMGLSAVLVTLGIMLALFGATYYLFFAPVPGIEILSSPEVQKAAQISTITLDTSSITGSPVLNVLKSHVGPPAQGSFGRENPFLPFVAAQQQPSAATR